MRTYRKLILLAAILIVGGSIGGTSWYACRMRSVAYRRSVERDVTAFLAMPASIREVQGRTFDSRDFVDVVVRLPNDGDVVFKCDNATWIEEGGDRHFLSLNRGAIVLGDAVWENRRYQSLLREGIGTDLKALELRGIHLDDFRIAFQKDQFKLECSGASGDIDLSKPGTGLARLTAHQLNGSPVPDGVRIVTEFVPDDGIQVRDIRLTVPSIPLPVLRLESFLSTEVTRGSFDGSIHYRIRAEDGLPEVEVGGRIDDAELAELTQTAPYGPYQGNVSLRVDEARFADRLMTHFKGGGAIRELSFASFAPLLQMPALDGEASFVFDEVHIALGVVHRVKLNGDVVGVSLEQLLNRWAQGGATGTVGVRINNFELVGETIRSADIEVVVEPPARGNAYVERQLLLDVAERALGFEWPSAIPKQLLPERVAYVSIGARLIVRDNSMRVLGTHGSGNRSIVTIRDPVFGSPVAVVKERAGSIDLGPYVRQAFERMRSYRPEDVKDWIDQKRGAVDD
jgi:hypothetical protein